MLKIVSTTVYKIIALASLPAVLGACQPAAEPPTAGQAPTAAPVPAPASAARPISAAPVAYDTISARHVYVNDRQLWVMRNEIRQELGAADSTATSYAGQALVRPQVLTETDSAVVMERYGGVVYTRVGNELFVLETQPNRPFRVHMGTIDLSQRTTAAQLRQFFPDSYRHRWEQPDGSVCLKLVPYLPDHFHDFTLTLRHGRLASFRQNYY